MRRILFRLLGGLLVTMLVAGCGGGGSSTSNSSSGEGGGEADTGPNTADQFINPEPESSITRHQAIRIGFGERMQPNGFWVGGNMLAPYGTTGSEYIATWDSKLWTVTLTPTNFWYGGASQSIFIQAFVADGSAYYYGDWTYDVQATPEATLSLPVGSHSSRSVSSPVIVLFTDSMNPDSLELSGSLLAATSYTFDWSLDQTQLTLTPADQWPTGGSQLQVIAQTLDGLDTIDSGLQPLILYHTDPQVEPDSSGVMAKSQPIQVTFPDPVDTNSVQFSGTLLDDAHTLAWSQSNRRLNIFPQTTWTLGPGATLAMSGLNTYGEALEPISADLEILDVDVAERTSSLIGGTSIAAHNGTVVVGNHYGSDTRVYTGSDGSWSLQQVIDMIPQETSANTYALSGDTLVMGRGRPIAGSTSVYVYTRTGSTWSEQTHIDAPESGRFGYSVAIEGDTLAVSNPKSHLLSDPSGPVRVYVRTAGSWTLQQEILPADLSSDGSLGRSLSLSGDTLVIGTPPITGQSSIENRGYLYVYKRTGGVWDLEAKILPPTESAQLFADQVLIQADTLFTADPWYANRDFSRGNVFVYSRAGATWSLAQELTRTYRSSENFGTALGYDGTTLAIAGVRNDYLTGSGPNTPICDLYRFVGGAWRVVQQLDIGHTYADYYFKKFLTSDSGHVFVGSSNTSTYVFR